MSAPVDYLSARQFCALLKCSPKTVRKLCSLGMIAKRPSDGAIPVEAGRAALEGFLANSRLARDARKCGRVPGATPPALPLSPPPPPPPPPPPSAAPSPTPTPTPAPTPTPTAPAPLAPRKAVRVPPAVSTPDPLLECGSIQTAISRQRFQLLKIEEEKKRLELDKLRGDSVPVDAMKAEVARVCSAVAACLHSIPARVSVLCEGRDAVAIEALLSDAINESLAAFRKVKLPSLDSTAAPEVPEPPEASGGADDADDADDSGDSDG